MNFDSIHPAVPLGTRLPWTKECSNNCTTALISHSSKVMLKILQARFQQYMNCELPGVQAGFWKGTGTRDQIANIHWIIKKAREFQKNHLLLLYWLHQSLWLCGSQQIVENSSRDGNTRPPHLPPEKSVCRLKATVRTGNGTTDWLQIRERVGHHAYLKEYIVTMLI